MSTRVHELAKELGLKSAELLERIQSWGLDVKASNFASLDPATVDRIRDLSARSASGQAPSSAAHAARVACVPGVAALRFAGARRLDRARGRAGREAGGPAPASPARPRSEPAARAGAVAGTGAGQQPGGRAGARSQDLVPAVAPGAATAGTAGLAAAPGGTRSGNGFGAAIVAARRLLELAARRRPAFGTYAASRDRRGRPGSSGPPSGGRPEPRPGPAELAGRVDHRSMRPAVSSRLKPGDYMSSAGIRTMTPRVSPAPPASSRARRPPATAGGESRPARLRRRRTQGTAPAPGGGSRALRGRRLHRARPRRARRSRPSVPTNR